MRRVLLSACSAAVLAACGILLTDPASAADTPRGKIIGDGINLPREFVAGKGPAARAIEILTWMKERGSTTDRECDAKKKRCAFHSKLVLSNGGVLWLSSFEHFDGTQDYTTYCRTSPTKDTVACYNLQSATYFSKVKDSASGKWETIWNERDEKKSDGTIPANGTDQLL